jgi:8-oxo-dGTP pyrophosphatase MutT (NUDIX family)
MNRLLLTYSINNSKSLLTKTSQRFLTTGEHDLKIDYLKKSLEPFSRPPNDYEKLLVKHPSIGKLKRSSILVPITIKHEKNEQGVRVQKSYYTLTQRANTVKYKGEVCFVGGNRDITDTNDIHTAFREANEEIGMDADRLTFLAQLCPIVNTKGDLITPILAYFDDTDYTAKCNQHEVTHAFKLPTERFILNSGHTFKSFKSGKIELNVLEEYYKQK